jgi:hypothetical protein
LARTRRSPKYSEASVIVYSEMCAQTLFLRLQVKRSRAAREAVSDSLDMIHSCDTAPKSSPKLLPRIEGLNESYESQSTRREGSQNNLEIFLILASDSDSNRSRGVERGPHYQIRSPSPLLTLTHLNSPSITDKATLTTFPNRNRFCTGEESS